MNAPRSGRGFRPRLRHFFRLRYLAPILSALILTYGPYLRISTAPKEDFSGDSFLSLVPDGALQSLGRMRRPYGMGAWQFDAYIRACAKADVSPFRVSQTIGRAKLSAGYHAQDGVARENGAQNPYCAATDLSTRGLSTAQIKALLSGLADADFPGWYRYTGSFTNAHHVHAVFAGYPMKSQLRAQIEDFLHDKTGLAGHARERFWVANGEQKKRLDGFYKRFGGKI